MKITLTHSRKIQLQLAKSKQLFYILSKAALLLTLLSVTNCSGSSSTTRSNTPTQDLPDSQGSSGEAGSGESSSSNLEKAQLQASQLNYLGVFRLPRAGGGGASRFGYGGWGFALNVDGDASGADDDFPGSIYVVSFDNDQLVAELNIPVPLKQREIGVDQLNTASFLQNFTDITGGMAPALDPGPVSVGFKINGLAYLPAQGAQTAGHIYWTARQYYNVDRSNDLSHGMSDLDFSAPHAQGMWRLGTAHNLRTAGYLMTIPQDFANTYLGGKRLASGLFTQQGVSATSAGPAFFAFAPWLDAVDGSPESGATLEVTPLTYYPYNEDGSESGVDITESSWWVNEGSSNFPEFQIPDRWDSATWIETANTHGILVFGQRSDGRTYYGDARAGDCSIDKGYHGEPFHPSIVFYDPADLAAVAQGDKEATEVVPYFEWDTMDAFENTCIFEFNGAGYDSQNQLLYVLQRNADRAGGEPQPLVYVFRVEDGD